MTWEAWIETELDRVRAAGQWRQTRAFDAFGPAGMTEGVGVVSFASNDYLGLSAHPAVIEAAVDAARRWGTGATASRLIVGTRPPHHDLEAEISAWKQSEAALVLPTGYAANLAVLGVVGGPEVTVCSDELNHASIIDGCRLSRSSVRVYRHRDVDHLDSILAGVPGRRVVVSDSVFSMDGDLAPVEELREVCRRRDALLILDEAHAVLGPHPHPDDDRSSTIRVGTMSKTLGALGGWVAASRSVIDLLINRARPFIFTTALTPADTAAALAALRVLRSDEGDSLIARLRVAIDRVVPGHPSPIVPIVLGDEDRSVKIAAAMFERGLLVPAIRPPTVPPGTSRLRVTLSATHTDEMLDRLLTAFGELGVHP